MSSNKPFNPIPELPHILKNQPAPEAAKPQKKVKKQRESSESTAEPIYIRKLFEHYNNKCKVARILGCSDPVIVGAIANNIVTKAYEIAAQYYYILNIEKPANQKVAVSALVPDDVWAMLEPWLVSAGVQYQSFKS